MDFYEVIQTRRSVRAYRSDPMPEDVLERVLNAARIAPSGSNRQPTRLILVKDEERGKLRTPACRQAAGEGTLADPARTRSLKPELRALPFSPLTSAAAPARSSCGTR